MEVRKVTREFSEKNEELSESKMSMENQKVWTLYQYVYYIRRTDVFRTKKVLNLTLFNTKQLSGKFESNLRGSAVTTSYRFVLQEVTTTDLELLCL